MGSNRSAYGIQRAAAIEAAWAKALNARRNRNTGPKK